MNLRSRLAFLHDGLKDLHFNAYDQHSWFRGMRSMLNKLPVKFRDILENTSLKSRDTFTFILFNILFGGVTSHHVRDIFPEVSDSRLPLYNFGICTTLCKLLRKFLPRLPVDSSSYIIWNFDEISPTKWGIFFNLSCTETFTIILYNPVHLSHVN